VFAGPSEPYLDDGEDILIYTLLFYAQTLNKAGPAELLVRWGLSLWAGET
jgi:hypothetical protein